VELPFLKNIIATYSSKRFLGSRFLMNNYKTTIELVATLSFSEKFELLKFLKESIEDNTIEYNELREKAILEYNSGKTKLESPKELFSRLGL